MASNTSGSQPVFTVEWNAAFGMNTAWPGPTSKVSESSTICSPRPLRMYRISSLSGWLWRSCPSPGSSTTRMRLIAGPSVFSVATSGLITPQSKLMVGRLAGSISLDGTVMLLSCVGERLEAAHVLRHRDLGGQALHAGRAEEPDHALRSLEDVLRVLRFGQRASVAEHHPLGIDRHRRVAHRLDQLDAFVQRERGLRPDRPLRGESHVRHEHIRSGARHRLRRLRVEDIGSREEPERPRLSDHLDLEVVSHPRLLEVRAEGPVDQPDRGEVLNAREPRVAHLDQEPRHQPEGVGAANARQHRRVVHDREHLAAHVHDDRVGVAVRQQPGQRAATRHPVAARVVDDDQIRPAGFGALGRQARSRAGPDDDAAAVERRAELGARLVARHRRPRMYSSSWAAIAIANSSSLMLWSSSTSSTSEPPRPSRKESNSAASASGSWNGWPSASIIDTPFSGTNRLTGPLARRSLAAMRRPSSAHSSRVVRMSVTEGLCT